MVLVSSTRTTTTLLEKTQALIELERSLTQSIERIEPWLLNSRNDNYNSRSSNKTNVVGIRVRPIPTDMDQVEKVLAVARIFSTRTSAPAGWNTNAPVVGFSTPNPLPHQLRGGALAALELQRARQVERDKKRKRQEEEEKEKKAKQEQEADSNYDKKKETDIMDNDGDVDSKNQTSMSKTDNIKRSDTSRNQTGEHLGSKRPAPTSSTTRPRTGTRYVQPAVTMTMNLSDSSSSEEDENNDDSD